MSGRVVEFRVTIGEDTLNTLDLIGRVYGEDIECAALRVMTLGMKEIAKDIEREMK